MVGPIRRERQRQRSRRNIRKRKLMNLTKVILDRLRELRVEGANSSDTIPQLLPQNEPNIHHMEQPYLYNDNRHISYKRTENKYEHWNNQYYPERSIRNNNGPYRRKSRWYDEDLADVWRPNYDDDDVDEANRQWNDANEIQNHLGYNSTYSSYTGSNIPPLTNAPYYNNTNHYNNNYDRTNYYNRYHYPETNRRQHRNRMSGGQPVRTFTSVNGNSEQNRQSNATQKMNDNPTQRSNGNEEVVEKNNLKNTSDNNNTQLEETLTVDKSTQKSTEAVSSSDNELANSVVPTTSTNSITETTQVLDNTALIDMDIDSEAETVCIDKEKSDKESTEISVDCINTRSSFMNYRNERNSEGNTIAARKIVKRILSDFDVDDGTDYVVIDECGDETNSNNTMKNVPTKRKNSEGDAHTEVKIPKLDNRLSEKGTSTNSEKENREKHESLKKSVGETTSKQNNVIKLHENDNKEKEMKRKPIVSEVLDKTAVISVLPKENKTLAQTVKISKIDITDNSEVNSKEGENGTKNEITTATPHLHQSNVNKVLSAEHRRKSICLESNNMGEVAFKEKKLHGDDTKKVQTTTENSEKIINASEKTFQDRADFTKYSIPKKLSRDNKRNSQQSENGNLDTKNQSSIDILQNNAQKNLDSRNSTAHSSTLTKSNRENRKKGKSMNNFQTGTDASQGGTPKKLFEANRIKSQCAEFHKENINLSDKIAHASNVQFCTSKKTIKKAKNNELLAEFHKEKDNLCEKISHVATDHQLSLSASQKAKKNGQNNLHSLKTSKTRINLDKNDSSKQQKLSKQRSYEEGNLVITASQNHNINNENEENALKNEPTTLKVSAPEVKQGTCGSIKMRRRTICCDIPVLADVKYNVTNKQAVNKMGRKITRAQSDDLLHLSMRFTRGLSQELGFMDVCELPPSYFERGILVRNRHGEKKRKGEDSDEDSDVSSISYRSSSPEAKRARKNKHIQDLPKIIPTDPIAKVNIKDPRLQRYCRGTLASNQTKEPSSENAVSSSDSPCPTLLGPCKSAVCNQESHINCDLPSKEKKCLMRQKDFLANVQDEPSEKRKATLMEELLGNGKTISEKKGEQKETVYGKNIYQSNVPWKHSLIPLENRSSTNDERKSVTKQKTATENKNADTIRKVAERRKSTTTSSIDKDIRKVRDRRQSTTISSLDKDITKMEARRQSITTSSLDKDTRYNTTTERRQSATTSSLDKDIRKLGERRQSTTTSSIDKGNNVSKQIESQITHRTASINEDQRMQSKKRTTSENHTDNTLTNTKRLAARRQSTTTSSSMGIKKNQDRRQSVSKPNLSDMKTTRMKGAVQQTSDMGCTAELIEEKQSEINASHKKSDEHLYDNSMFLNVTNEKNENFLVHINTSGKTKSEALKTSTVIEISEETIDELEINLLESKTAHQLIQTQITVCQEAQLFKHTVVEASTTKKQKQTKNDDIIDLTKDDVDNESEMLKNVKSINLLMLSVFSDKSAPTETGSSNSSTSILQKPNPQNCDGSSKLSTQLPITTSKKEANNETIITPVKIMGLSQQAVVSTSDGIANSNTIYGQVEESGSHCENIQVALDKSVYHQNMSSSALEHQTPPLRNPIIIHQNIITPASKNQVLPQSNVNMNDVQSVEVLQPNVTTDKQTPLPPQQIVRNQQYMGTASSTLVNLLKRGNNIPLITESACRDMPLIPPNAIPGSSQSTNANACRPVSNPAVIHSYNNQLVGSLNRISYRAFDYKKFASELGSLILLYIKTVNCVTAHVENCRALSLGEANIMECLSNFMVVPDQVRNILADKFVMYFITGGTMDINCKMLFYYIDEYIIKVLKTRVNSLQLIKCLLTVSAIIKQRNPTSYGANKFFLNIFQLFKEIMEQMKNQQLHQNPSQCCPSNVTNNESRYPNGNNTVNGEVQQPGTTNVMTLRQKSIFLKQCESYMILNELINELHKRQMQIINVNQQQQCVNQVRNQRLIMQQLPNGSAESSTTGQRICAQNNTNYASSNISLPLRSLQQQVTNIGLQHPNNNANRKSCNNAPSNKPCVPNVNINSLVNEQTTNRAIIQNFMQKQNTLNQDVSASPNGLPLQQQQNMQSRIIAPIFNPPIENQNILNTNTNRLQPPLQKSATSADHFIHPCDNFRACFSKYTRSNTTESPSVHATLTSVDQQSTSLLKESSVGDSATSVNESSLNDSQSTEDNGDQDKKVNIETLIPIKTDNSEDEIIDVDQWFIDRMSSEEIIDLDTYIELNNIKAEDFTANPIKTDNENEESPDVLFSGSRQMLTDDPIPRNPSVDSGVSSPPRQIEHPEILLADRTCICFKKADLVCQCKMAIYCSRECQINNWPHHQELCLRIREETSTKR